MRREFADLLILDFLRSYAPEEMTSGREAQAMTSYHVASAMAADVPGGPSLMLIHKSLLDYLKAAPENLHDAILADNPEESSGRDGASALAAGLGYVNGWYGSKYASVLQQWVYRPEIVENVPLLDELLGAHIVRPAFEQRA